MMRSIIAMAALASTTFAQLPDYVISNNGELWIDDKCVTGKEQSPVNLREKNWTTYRSSAVSTVVAEDYINPRLWGGKVGGVNDFSWQVNMPVAAISGKMKLTLAGATTEYYPTKFNFHIPSEHTVDGVNHSAELQIEHTNADGDLAVIGVFFSNATATTENIFLKSLFDSYDASVSTDIAFADFITSLNFTAHW